MTTGEKTAERTAAQAARPHWHILGSGAMACLWAEALCRSGATVSLISRHGNAPILQRIRYRTIKGEQRECEVELLCAEQLGCQRIERLLIATKAQDASIALHSVASRLTPRASLLSLCNGLGMHAALQQCLEQHAPDGQLLLAVSTDGAKLNAPFDVLYSGIGHSWIGRYREIEKQSEGAEKNTVAREKPATEFPPPHLPPHFPLQYSYCDDISAPLWKKFFINCVINPLSVKFDCLNGDLIAREAARSETLSLCKELQKLYDCIAVMQGLPDIVLAEEVTQVAEKTAGNSSSMRCDRRRGRTLEIDHLNGEAQRLAAQHRCHCPLNDALVQYLATNP